MEREGGGSSRRGSKRNERCIDFHKRRGAAGQGGGTPSSVAINPFIFSLSLSLRVCVGARVRVRVCVEEQTLPSSFLI